jgi:hypothetical protein
MTLVGASSSAAAHPRADDTAIEEGQVSPFGERQRRRIAHPAALPRPIAPSGDVRGCNGRPCTDGPGRPILWA